MKYLFVHQNFPGQYLHLARQLAREGGNDVRFITSPNENRMIGVQKIEYQYDVPVIENIHPAAKDFDAALRRAEAVASTAKILKSNGFDPDIIIGHHGWGEMLNLEDVWPKAPQLGYFEFYYKNQGLDVGFDPEFILGSEHLSRVRARNAVNHLALNGPSQGQTPTEFQLSTYPEENWNKISLLKEGVDLSICTPNPQIKKQPFTLMDKTFTQDKKIVTFVSRSLEPYRGFHIMMRSLPDLLQARKDIEVIIVGAEGTSYGPRLVDESWKNYFLKEIQGSIDIERVHFVGRVDYNDHIRILQRSDAHIYLTYPFVASWSLREALACGCPIIASDTKPVLEFILNDINGILVPFFDFKNLSQKILELLEDQWITERLSSNARAFASKHLNLEVYINNYKRLIKTLLD